MNWTIISIVYSLIALLIAGLVLESENQTKTLSSITDADLSEYFMAFLAGTFWIILAPIILIYLSAKLVRFIKNKINNKKLLIFKDTNSTITVTTKK